MTKVVVALGGNALEDNSGEATAEKQLQVVEQTVEHLIKIVEDGNTLVIAHGNGPQVGRILIQNEVASDVTPAMPFDVCGAMSQGMIGYHLQQAMGNALRNKGIDKPVSTILTQVVVDRNDPRFDNPTKPIGPFYSEDEARKLEEEKGYSIVEDSGRGYRRVVASPEPKRIVELPVIQSLIDHQAIVITVGGGGIPVIEEESGLKGIAAVIDKDYASQRLAEDIDADLLVMLTGVDNVAINFGTPDQKNLEQVSVDEMKQYITENHFAPGSMLPKVEAGIRFVESKPGRKAIITSLEGATMAIKGETGTIIS